MGTWLKRNTSKKYVFNHEQESMDQILNGLIQSKQPEQIKSAFIKKICEKGQEASQPPHTIRAVLQVSCQWICHGTSTLQVASGFKLLNSWGTCHLETFQDFFTPSLVAELFQPVQGRYRGQEANLPLLIREGLRVMSHVGPHVYYEHAKAVQANITGFICTMSERIVVRNACFLLDEFKECIPSTNDDVISFCLALLHHLSAGMPPENRHEVERFISFTDKIANFLSIVWKLHPPTLLLDCLAEVFRIIAMPRTDMSEPAVCLAAVVKHIPIDLASRVVKDAVTDPSITLQSVALAVGQIVEWLKWPTAANVDMWVSCFLRELTVSHKYSLLVRIIEANTDQVLENLTIPHARQASLKILHQMLLSFQHSPAPFHKALERMPIVIGSLREEMSQESTACLTQLAQLIHCLMFQHTGFPELYEPILETIKDFPAPSAEDIQSVLNQSKWSAQVSEAHVVDEEFSPALMSSIRQEKLETGKAGLDNLGNTCYMNSVLQSLYMCDQFRHGVLSKIPCSQEGLLVKLQHVFAMLSQSSRPVISPCKFLQASRPPWFLPGHQQDCSEFLKYLLDQLHEDEKSLSSSSHKVMKKSQSSGSITTAGSSKMNNGTLGRSAKKEAVLLTALKFKTEEEMNEVNTNGSANVDSGQLQPSLVERTFRGKVQTTLRCLVCKKESKRVESFSDIPLAFPNSFKAGEYPHQILAGGSGVTEPNCEESVQTEMTAADRANPSEDHFTLNDLITFYLKPEKLTGDNKYHCDHCKKLQDGERSIHIIESPQYLILTLLRFSYDIKLQNRTKIFHDVQYPRTLAVPIYTLPPNKDTRPIPSKTYNRSISLPVPDTSRSEHHSTKFQDIAKSLPPKCDNSYSGPLHCDLYGLSSVIVHSGTSSECGHYYCYARHSQGGLVDPKQLDQVTGNLSKLDLLPDKWYNFNDSRVSHADFESFSNVSKKFSKDTPYVLIYRKLGAGCPPGALNPEPPLRADLRDAVLQDNEKYLQEQEVEARVREEQRRRSASVSSINLQKWRDSHEDDDDSKSGGPPGCGEGLGGGGLDLTGSRFVF